MRGPFLVLFVLAGVGLAAGCSDDDAATDDGGGDGGGDGGDIDELGDGEESEWGPECLVDDDCRDDIDCTVDICDRGLCRNTPDPLPCQNDQVCDGQEVCDPRDGCVPGEPFRGCNDGDACTMDRCIEPEPGMAPNCDHLDLDRDGDTYVDLHCGGDDCEDIDPLSHPDAMERCFDTFDNNCDGFIDTLDPVCQMNFDTCATPRELEPGVEWEGFTNGSTAGVDASCDIDSYSDVVFSFTVTETSDALLSVDAGSEYAYVALQRTCGDAASELRCASSSQVSIFERALPPGTYYVTVSGWDSPDVTGDEFTFRIRVDLTPSGPAAPGDSCDDPIALTLPAHEEGDLTRMDDDVALTCASWMDGADTVYTFELTEPQDLTIDVAAARISPYVALQSACLPAGTPLVCDSGYPFHRTIGNVPAGTYYLWVEASGSGTYSLDVSGTPPTPPPENDVCTGAVDVSAGGRFEGTLLSSADDYAPSCTGSTRDVAYVLTIAEPKAVSVVLRAHYDLWPYLVVTTECGNRAAEVACQWYEYPTTVDWRLLDAGTYYLVVEASEEGTFDLEVTISDPVDPCAGLTVIDATGPVSGTTVGGFDDFSSACGGSGGQDVTYELQVAAPSRFVAEIAPMAAGDWDTVLYLRSACDNDTATVLACNDDYAGIGLRSHIEVASLAAGTYYLTVDGLGSYASGTYTMNVTLNPL
ncbi:MAG: putative metal-binding motif-containing protein [Deltaproteobacteria bacterium]|nr:putative metal-binding motif-containing protein [Deltaproteobacteria bacterium]